MNPDRIAMLQDTFEKIRPAADKVAAAFYAKLFELDPAVKPLFKGDMKKAAAEG